MGLKSISGLNRELRASKKFHSEGIPLLVSGHTLRKRQLGQVDLSRLIKISNEWRVDLCEVKSSQVGIDSLNRGQSKRLIGSGNFLSSIFGAQMKLTKIVG